MSRQNRKERRRLKRKAKQKQAVRLRNASPYRRLTDSGHVEACLINDDWKEEGHAVLFVLATVPGKPPAMAVFMIDLWCAGLKDAWGRLQTDGQEFREVARTMADGAGLEIVPCDVELARELVAGSVRLAHDTGFLLPPRYERWLAVLGGVGDWTAANLRHFGVDGKLRWVGPVEDLERRLVGCTVDEFLGREDVEYILGQELVGDQEYFDDDLDERIEASEAVEEVAALLQHQVLDGVRRWCFANGEAPHPRLGDVVEMNIEAILQTPASVPEGAEDEEAEAAGANFEQMLQLEPPETAAELGAAIGQFQRFTNSFSTRDEYEEAIGLEEALREKYGEED